MSPVLQADSLPAEPQGRPKNTGVGILSLPQRIEPGSLALQADSLPVELPGNPTMTKLKKKTLKRCGPEILLGQEVVGF